MCSDLGSQSQGSAVELGIVLVRCKELVGCCIRDVLEVVSGMVSSNIVACLPKLPSD